MTVGQRLRQAIAERRALLVPGAANALTARIIEDLDVLGCGVRRGR